MPIYAIIFILQLLLLLAYFRIANYFKIIDIPVGRSSHYKATIRGGGIIFPIAVLLWFLMLERDQYLITCALLLVSAVSFYDDVKTLPSGIRIITQFLAVSLLFWQLSIFEVRWYEILLLYFFTIGWINAFNFMDCINGISAIYGLVSLGSFAWLNHSVDFASQQLIVILIISVLIFSFFNARNNAKTFAGDVGSVSLAFLLAWFMLSLILKTGHFEYILFFAVYGIDAIVTILFRLSRKENIFSAHRTHLYQYLSNECKYPHMFVTCIYGMIQLIVNIITIKLISLEQMSNTIFFLFLLILCLTYLFFRHVVHKRLQSRNY